MARVAVKTQLFPYYYLSASLNRHSRHVGPQIVNKKFKLDPSVLKKTCARGSLSLLLSNLKP